MPQRPPIPRPLERRGLIEAGHRCAISTCMQTPIELAHIVPWGHIREHIFENLIALCPTCHTRYNSLATSNRLFEARKLNIFGMLVGPVGILGSGTYGGVW